MTINVRFYGAIKKAMPRDHQGTHKVHARTYQEVLSYCQQHYDLRSHLATKAIDVRIGDDLTTSRYLTADQVARWSIPNGATVHVVPNANGAITGAILVTALVSAAIAIGVTILANLLFPMDAEKGDTRKSAQYQSGLQTSKEGVPVPYCAGDRVFCGGNVIEGDYDYTNSGGANVYAAGFGGIDFDSSGEIVKSILKQGGSAGGIPTDASQVQEGITSFKGGGGKTISNTTYSDATIRFAMVYGSGETGGIVGSNGVEKSKNILINEVPLVDRGTGQPNYHGISWEERFGVEGQSALKLTPDTGAPFSVDIELKQRSGAGGGQFYSTQTVTGADVDRVKLDFRIDQLVKTDSKGNQSRTSVTFGADVKRMSASAWTPAGSWSVNEKSTSSFNRMFVIAAPAKTAGNDADPWMFRVYRTTPDSSDDKLANGTTFKGWVEIKSKDYRYDGTEVEGAIPVALFAAALDGSQFDVAQKPEVALIVQGQKVRVPDNYDPVSRSYAGSWSGAWKYAVTANPVWHWLEIATSTEVGCGFPLTFFDKFDLYQTAKRCDQNIHGRFRYTVNKQFADETDGWQFLCDLAQTFRSIPYFNGTQIVLAQDRPGAPDHFINNSAVEEGKFTYTSTPGDQQFNEVIVQWDNPDDYYRVNNERYQDVDSIQRNRKHHLSNNGIVSKTVYKHGCTNRQEAYDYARALVFDAQNQTNAVTFVTSINACGYAPGQRILIDDWNLSGKEITGRLVSVRANAITVDKPITYKANTSYDALLITDNHLVRRPLVQVNSTSVTATFGCDTSGIAADTPVSIVENTPTAAQPLEYKISDIQEQETGKFQVTALRYIEGKHEWLDNGTPVQFVPWSQVNLVTPKPTGMTFSAYSYVDELAGTKRGIDVRWDAIAADLTGYGTGLALAGYTLEVQRPGSSKWEQVYKGADNFTTIRDAEPGLYGFSLRSLNSLGRSSAAEVVMWTYANDGSAGLQPPSITGFK
ncbi:phage tail protein [Sphingomonas sp. Leaf28]|uniref:TipJ family phage tail tip protein n=1 Tax=Sphingomonas sp. Leaf28 TaxID=1735695 RepID=UPI000AE0ACF3|nr:phage tail protein [Sphingomonas sp. Leaf28]